MLVIVHRVSIVIPSAVISVSLANFFSFLIHINLIFYSLIFLTIRTQNTGQHKHDIIWELNIRISKYLADKNLSLSYLVLTEWIIDDILYIVRIRTYVCILYVVYCTTYEGIVSTYCGSLRFIEVHTMSLSFSYFNHQVN